MRNTPVVQCNGSDFSSSRHDREVRPELVNVCLWDFAAEDHAQLPGSA